MSEVVLEFEQVWKKFKRGERHDSLRDLIPAMVKRLFSENNREELKEAEFWAVKDLSFQVKKGEALGIIGPNGAGKSTILKLLSGILRPNKGKIKVMGRLSALIEVGAGFHPDLTGRENIYLNGAILGMKKNEIDKKLDEIVAFSGLEDFLDTPVKRYSSGMYARLGFSVAAHVDPDILLVDEVLSVGDMKFQQKCLERMRYIVDKGVTIIFISHNLESVQILCPDSLYIRKGQKVIFGDTAQVIKEYVCSSEKIETTNQLAQIEQVFLYNQKGETSATFNPGDKAEIRFVFKCVKPIEECLLVFIVVRVTDGLSVCDYSLPTEAIMNGDSNRSNEISATIKFNTNLLRGTYSITLGIYHHSSAQFLCRLDNCVTFFLEERISWQGVSHLNPILERSLEGT